MAPLKQRHSYILDDGPCSRLRGEDLVETRRRNPSEFERAPVGGVNEVAIYEAYLEAGMRSGVPSIVAEVSSYFGFCLSPLTPLSWRTLMAIQVLGELRGFHIKVYEVLYSYCFAQLASKPGFYFLRPCDGAPLVKEPSRGAGGNYPFGDNWDNRYVFLKFQEPIRYPTFWRIVGKSLDLQLTLFYLSSCIPSRLVSQMCLVPCLCLGGSGKASDERSSTVPTGELPGNVVELPIYAILKSYQGVKTKRKRSSHALPPRLARTAALGSGPPLLLSVDAGAEINRSFRGDAHQKLFSEVLSLRGQVQDMMVHRDRFVQQVRVAAR
ncbi:hypothetical protein Bca101_026246 [Brassica carinata]